MHTIFFKLYYIIFKKIKNCKQFSFNLRINILIFSPYVDRNIDLGDKKKNNLF